uniref:Uncharacterized protein n=1 Tax=Oryza brachyantha TaxID=4533 RepID=J3LIZ9_ORYBR
MLPPREAMHSERRATMPTVSCGSSMRKEERIASSRGKAERESRDRALEEVDAEEVAGGDSGGEGAPGQRQHLSLPLRPPLPLPLIFSFLLLLFFWCGPCGMVGGCKN